MKNLITSKRRLEPQEIRSKEFTKKLFGFGYDPDEVEAFLIEVANAYQELLEELENLRRNVPVCSAEEVVEEGRMRIEEIFRRKTEMEEEIERQKEEIEMEIEKLKLVRKRIFNGLRLIVFDTTRIIMDMKSGGRFRS